MNAFIGLVKKDMAITRFGYLLWLITMILLFIGSFPLSKYFGERTIIVAVAFVIFTAHAFFLPATMYSTLTKEGKTQLWLHSPQSSTKLLLSKLVSLASFQILSQCIVTIYCVITFKIFAEHHVFASLVEMFGFKEILLVNSLILDIALYLSIWIIFYWTIYHSLGQYPLIKKFRWFVLILIYVIYNVMKVSIARIPIVEGWIAKWTTEINPGLFLNYSPDGWTIEFMTEFASIIPFILYGILALILFIISSKLLDRKVEV